MDHKEINPQLKKELEHLQEIPQRGLQASHAGRETFLLRAKGLKPRQVAAGKTVRKTGRSWVPRLAAIFTVLLVALSSIGGTAYAAQASQPDDFLYPVKILTEDIQIGLENDPEDRLDLFISFAARRLAEIQAQVDAGEEVSTDALTRLESHTHQMMQEAAQMSAGNVENALRQVQQALELQNEVMTKLQTQTPGGGEPGLVKAQEEVESRLQLVENGINEPQGFQEQMQIEESGNGKNDGNIDSPGNSGDTSGSENEETMPGSENGKGSGGK
ncbi:MAG: hypothetical protein HQ574_01785 [Chloroflexi bacterium]|nr:hypothetical protein [Chloroflexota bacterium]